MYQFGFLRQPLSPNCYAFLQSEIANPPLGPCPDPVSGMPCGTSADVLLQDTGFLSVVSRQQVMVRHYGLYANAHRGKAKKASLVPVAPPMAEEEPESVFS
jgi:hypothetical protein